MTEPTLFDLLDAPPTKEVQNVEGLCRCGHTTAQHLKQKYYVGKCMCPSCLCEEFVKRRR
jgi:hypothetical protein